MYCCMLWLYSRGFLMHCLDFLKNNIWNKKKKIMGCSKKISGRSSSHGASVRPKLFSILNTFPNINFVCENCCLEVLKSFIHWLDTKFIGWFWKFWWQNYCISIVLRCKKRCRTAWRWCKNYKIINILCHNRNSGEHFNAMWQSVIRLRPS